MEVEFISRECIQPSSPTPLHLKIYKICLLDQCNHHTYIPMILYYPVNRGTNLSNQTEINLIVSERLQLLKKSLPQTLARFHPFAGKFKDNLSVDCNDEGIYFIEARVKCSLCEFLDQQNLSLISKFIPFDGGEEIGSISGFHVAKIQATTFSCGGLVICACLSHLFGDGITLCSFLKSWAAAARGNTEEEIICPKNDASILFPQNNAHTEEATWAATCAPFCRSGRFVTRRFVFDAKAIDILKAEATSPYVQNPTRVETVLAFISKCLMAAIKSKSGNSHKPTLLTLSVNLRRRDEPPLSDYCMGNLAWNANILCTKEQEDLDDLVCLLRKAIMNINGDFVKSLQGDKGFSNLCEAIKNESGANSGAKDKILLTSWCNFGPYGIDFGWGKPVWFSSGAMEGITNFMSSIVLMDSRLGNGIEAWAYLLKEDMDILEVNEELLAFATLDPSPLA